MSQIIDIPVVIVGGGSCGLNLSIFLSDLNVEHIMFERHPGTSNAPKAHVINQRTMEIWRLHGIADPIIKQGTPARQMSQVVWQTSLGGEGPLDRKVLATIDTWGCKAGTQTNVIYQRESPHLPANLPLLRSEPIFREIAEKRNPGKVLYSHTVLDFEEGKDGVTVQVKNPEGIVTTYRAQYLVGADGGKTVGPKLGVEMEGPKGLRQVTSAHFKADVSRYWDDRTCITNFVSPENPGFSSGAMLPLGPTWGRQSEEWQMHFTSRVGDDALTKESAKRRIKDLLKLPDLPLEITNTSTWVLERVLANKYQTNRIFLAGDAAHRHPPTTGLGLNTAVQDAQNLGWKLALVLSGKATPELLKTYEHERRHIGQRNCDWAFLTSKRRLLIEAALGLQEGQAEANRAHLTELFDEELERGRAKRAIIQDIVNGQEVEFSAHDLDLGFYYPRGSFVPDGTKPPPEDPRHVVYTPCTRPGHRLPHAWVERDGKIFSTHDLVGTNGRFLLITAHKGGAWIEAAKGAAEQRGIQLDAVEIIPPFMEVKGRAYVDSDEQWTKVRGFDDDGAILVRPDTIVAWRAQGSSGTDIGAAFDSILGR